VELGLSVLIQQAHAAGVKVIGATIPPLANVGESAYPPVEARRQQVNARIRRVHHDALDFDAVLDMDAALRDPQHPWRVDARFSGCAFGDCDKWHPGQAGHRAVADAFDLAVLQALAAR